MDNRLRQSLLDEMAAVYAEVKTVLDERQRQRQRRLLLGSVAQRLGRGGIKLVAAAVGVDRDTVSRGVRDLAAGPVADGRVRAPGAGRPAVTRSVPGVVEALERLVEPVTRGDPQSPLRWTNKSTEKLADALTGQGFSVAPRTWPSCSRRVSIGCRPTRRWCRVVSIPTGTPSSSKSTTGLWISSPVAIR